MKVYVEAQSKAALIRRLAAGEEISGYNYSMFGGGGHYMLDDSLEDGTIIAIYSQMSQGNPVAKSWGTWTNGVLKAETFESPVSCKICGKTFDSFRGLNGHMNAHIPSHRKRAETYAGIKEYDEKCPFCEKELSEEWWDGLEWIVEEGGRAKFHRSIEVNCPHCNEEFYIDDEDFSYADHMAGWEPSYIDQAESFSAENPKKAKPTFVLVTFEVYDGANEYTLHHIMSQNEYDTTEEGDLIRDFFGEADPDGSMFWIDSERAASIVAAQPITLHTRKLLNKLGFYAETFEAISDDYSISMKRSNPLSRHYIPTKKKSAESFSAEDMALIVGTIDGDPLLHLYRQGNRDVFGYHTGKIITDESEIVDTVESFGKLPNFDERQKKAFKKYKRNVWGTKLDAESFGANGEIIRDPVAEDIAEGFGWGWSIEPEQYREGQTGGKTVGTGYPWDEPGFTGKPHSEQLKDYGRMPYEICMTPQEADRLCGEAQKKGVKIEIGEMGDMWEGDTSPLKTCVITEGNEAFIRSYAYNRWRDWDTNIASLRFENRPMDAETFEAGGWGGMNLAGGVDEIEYMLGKKRKPSKRLPVGRWVAEGFVFHHPYDDTAECSIEDEWEDHEWELEAQPKKPGHLHEVGWAHSMGIQTYNMVCQICHLHEGDLMAYQMTPKCESCNSMNLEKSYDDETLSDYETIITTCLDCGTTKTESYEAE
jgi:hypothetical protein